MFVGEIFQFDLNVVLVFKSVFKHIELKHADYADNDFFKSRIKLLEYLDRTFLRDLFDTFDKLLSLHGIHLPYSCKMLGSEGGNTLILKV